MRRDRMVWMNRSGCNYVYTMKGTIVQNVDCNVDRMSNGYPSFRSTMFRLYSVTPSFANPQGRTEL